MGKYGPAGQSNETGGPRKTDRLLSSSFQVKAILWALGGLSAGMTAMIFITIMAIGKADAAQTTAADAKTAAATVANDVSWIKESVQRIEKKVDALKK
jgi:hypothetical protein